MHRHHPVLAYPSPEAHALIAVAAIALNVLEQQLPQQLRSIHYALTLDAVLRQFLLRQPRQLQEPVRVGHNSGQQIFARSPQANAVLRDFLPRYNTQFVLPPELA